MTILNLVEMAESSPKGEKQKLLVSPFSSGFTRLLRQTCKNKGLFGKGLALYLIYQFWARPIQQQIKMRSQKYGQMKIQLSDCVENMVGEGEIVRYGQCLLFPQSFQKLSVVDGSK